jgi:hypothetical protein
MNKELKHKIYAAGGCISEMTMFDYIDGKLSPKLQHEVEKHMLECELCSDALEGLMLVKNRRHIELINSAVRSRIAASNRSGMMDRTTIMSIAAGILLLFGGIFIFNQFTKNKKEDMAELKTVPAKEQSEKPESLSLNEDSVTLSDAEEKSKNNSVDSPESSEHTGEVISALKQDENTYTREAISQGVQEPTVKPTEEIIADELDINTNKFSTIPDQDAKKESEVSDKAINTPVAGNAAPAISGKDMAQTENTRNERITVSEQSNSKNEGYYDLETVSKSSKKNSTRAKEKVKNAETKESEQKPRADNYDFVLSNTTTGTTVWQNDTAVRADEKAYTIVDEMPAFPGGTTALEKFIRDHSSFEITKNFSEKTLSIQFVISTTGKAVDLITPAHSDEKTTKELQQLIQQMPLWSAGKLHGKEVPVFYNLNLQQR